MLDSITKGRTKKPTAEKVNSRPDKSRHKATSGSHRSHSHAAGTPLSFLFVVNELQMSDDDTPPCKDDWYNSVPPMYPAAYGEEIPSRVMRFYDGNVHEAPGYTWVRTGSSAPYASGVGLICGIGPDQHFLPAEQYKVSSVFSCNPFLPIVVLDGDPLVHGDIARYPLLFFHPRGEYPHLQGISQVVTEDSPMAYGGGPLKVVAGRNPSWMPSLVPLSYANSRRTAPESVGLGGELPIVIGLMAFAEARESGITTDEIFIGRDGHRGRWRDYRWTLKDAPKGYPKSVEHEPRGFLVSVFLDPQNEEGSTHETLSQFEWHRPIVVDSSKDTSRK